MGVKKRRKEYKVLCKGCGVEFETIYREKKFHTKECYWDFLKGKPLPHNPGFKKNHTPWNKGKECPQIGIFLKGKKRPEKVKKKISKTLKGKHNSPKTEFKKGNHPSSEFKKGSIPWNKGKTGLCSEKTLKKMGKSHIGQIPWNKGTKGIMKSWNKGMKMSEDYCRTNSEAQIKKYKKGRIVWNKGEKMGEEHYKNNCDSHNTEEYKKKTSKIHKEKFLNPEFLKKLHKSLNLKPNKKEEILIELLDKILPNEYKYVGDYSFWLEGRNPDFLNVNGQKKLIELFGDYWHNLEKFPNKETPEERISHFKKYGFDTLIIWEKELKNVDKLAKKIIGFNGE